MLFGISLTVWIVMLVCAVIAVLYVLIVDKKEGKRAEKRKYLAILMCIAIAVLATVLSKQQAYVGAPMIGLIVSILIVNIVPEGKMSKECSLRTAVGTVQHGVGICRILSGRA